MINENEWPSLVQLRIKWGDLQQDLHKERLPNTPFSPEPKIFAQNQNFHPNPKFSPEHKFFTWTQNFCLNQNRKFFWREIQNLNRKNSEFFAGNSNAKGKCKIIQNANAKGKCNRLSVKPFIATALLSIVIKLWGRRRRVTCPSTLASYSQAEIVPDQLGSKSK